MTEPEGKERSGNTGTVIAPMPPDPALCEAIAAVAAGTAMYRAKNAEMLCESIDSARDNLPLDTMPTTIRWAHARESLALSAALADLQEAKENAGLAAARLREMRAIPDDAWLPLLGGPPNNDSEETKVKCKRRRRHIEDAAAEGVEAVITLVNRTERRCQAAQRLVQQRNNHDRTRRENEEREKEAETNNV